MLPRWFWGLAVLSLLGHLALAACLPPADDELYYWCWSERLQLSYYDHPPMTAYLIRASTALFGDNVFAIRLPACLSTFAIVLLLGRWTQPLGVLLPVALTPAFVFGTILITPDTPLLLAWIVYLTWLIAVHRRLDAVARGERTHVGRGFWLLGGIALGGGILGKYTMGLAVPAGLLSFLLRPRSLAIATPSRQACWQVGYALHLLTAFVVSLPILLYNVQHDFAPLRFQWNHAMAAKETTIRHFPGFVGGQIALIGLVPFLVLPWAWMRRRQLWEDSRLRVCWCLFVLPFAFFLYKATQAKLEANWPLVSYLAVWPLAAVWLTELREKLRRRLLLGGFAIPAAASLLLAVHLSSPIDWLPARADILTRQKEKFAHWGEISQKVRQASPETPVLTTSYQETAQLRFQGINAHQIPGATRPSHFTQEPKRFDVEKELILLTESPWNPNFGDEYNPPEVLGQVPLQVRGELQTYHRLLRYTRKQSTTDRAEAKP